MVSNLVIIGPAWPLRGGLAAFDEKLSSTFSQKGINSSIETFSLQYPQFLFPGKTQYANWEAPQNLDIESDINSINPFNWFKIGRKIKKMNLNIEELKEKASKMELSELKNRVEKILEIFQSNDNNVIDKLIPLTEEMKILKLEADKRLGNIEKYLT